ncbi:MAG: NADH-quinone oxidoreductase subunit C [Neisseriaceae bacterium]
MSKLSDLQALVIQHAAGLYERLKFDHQELTIECNTQQYFELLLTLRDTVDLHFQQLIDLCGIDYLAYKNQWHEERRYAVVVHLLSITHNWRVRVRAFIDDNDLPIIASVISIYACANWYEREAFDMYGIIFKNHPDLRRILTDYNFVGYPLRKDFPISGAMEMVYDDKQKRVVYQPVSIEPRNNVPKVVREEEYGE